MLVGQPAPAFTNLRLLRPGHIIGDVNVACGKKLRLFGPNRGADEQQRQDDNRR
jgi:hypothetical protein